MLKSSKKIPQNDVGFLLSHLWAGGKYGNLWTNATKESKWFDLSQGIETVEVPPEWAEYNVYFGVHPSGRVGFAKDRTKIEDIHIVNALYAEFDIKDYGSLDAIKDHVWELDMRPSMQVESGGGLHCYWLLHAPFVIENDHDRSNIQKIQTSWVQYVGGDKGAHDLARVLRVPGTKNVKYDPPKEVKMVVKSTNRHDLEYIEEVLTDYMLSVPNSPARPEKPLPASVERVEVSGKIQIKSNVTPGDRNSSLITYGGALLGRRFNHWQAERLVRYKNDTFDPPLPPAEIDQLVNSLRTMEASDKSPLPTSQDYIDVCGLLGYKFKLNVMNDYLYVNGKVMTDVIEMGIKSDLRDFGLHQVNVAIDAYTSGAPKWHPVKDYLSGLSWDHEDHISKLASYFRDERDQFSWIFRRWLVGAVARIFENGRQNVVLVMDGKQRIGKSYFVRWLGNRVGPEHFHEAGINPDNKDDRIRLMTVWIWELSELSSTTRRSDVDALKHFLTREIVTERKSYGKHDIVKPASANFIATVNDAGYGFLVDPTGNRRFAIVTVQDINHGYAKDIDPDQVWAQAKELYFAGETPDFDGNQLEQLAMANEDYEIANPVHELLDEMITVQGPEEEEEGFVSSSDLTQRVRDTGISMGSMEISKQIAVWMKNKGIVKRRGYLNGVQKRGYWGVKLPPTLAQQAWGMMNDGGE